MRFLREGQATDEATAINALSPLVSTITDYKPEMKSFRAPIIKLQNAPKMPKPGAGLQGVTELLGSRSYHEA